LLIGDKRRGRFVSDESQLQVVDDSIHHGIVGEERDNPHLSSALRADEGINFIHFTDHFGPALGGDGPELLLEYPERGRPRACLPDLPSMGIGVETI